MDFALLPATSPSFLSLFAAVASAEGGKNADAGLVREEADRAVGHQETRAAAVVSAEAEGVAVDSLPHRAPVVGISPGGKLVSDLPHSQRVGKPIGDILPADFRVHAEQPGPRDLAPRVFHIAADAGEMADAQAPVHFVAVGPGG